MVEEAIEKADTLIEAMKWIREHRGKITVIKLGGSLMEEEAAMAHLLVDTVFMETVGMKPVIVHGGGNAISGAMDAAGIERRFIRGNRYTDESSLAIVRKVLGNEIPKRLVKELNGYGGQAEVLSDCCGTNVLFGKLLEMRDEHGDLIDLGSVGTVTRVDTEAINNLCERGVIPVIPSYTIMDDGSGRGLNVNADTAATEVAKALKADKLVFVSIVNGVLTDPNDPASMVNSLTAQGVRDLLDSGAIVGGMIPKIQACLAMIERGVEKIHIINGRLRHALLLEIFTSQGIGTEIVDVKP